MHFDLEKL